MLQSIQCLRYDSDMRKLFAFFLSFSFLFLLTSFVTPAYAAITCKVTTDPGKVTSDDTHIKALTVTVNGLNETKVYAIKISGATMYGSSYIYDQKFSGGKIVLTDVDSYGVPVSSSGGPFTPGHGLDPAANKLTYAPGTYSVEVIDTSFANRWSSGRFSEEQKCITTFTVEKGPGRNCGMFFPEPNVKASEDIKMQLTGLQDPNVGYITYVQKDSDKGKVVGSPICFTAAEYAAADGVSLGSFDNGVYFVSVFPSASGSCKTGSTAITSLITSFLSSGTLGVAKACSGILMVPGLAIGAGTPNAATLSGFLSFTGVIASPCRDEGSSTDPHYICPTAIGDIDTNTVAFVKQIFGILLSLSGGIALLLIIYSGYQIMTSEGNPEKLQGARETITSAIIGLVFIIFSLVILQIIGVDILRIPGFSK